jgi:hypothetical protein
MQVAAIGHLTRAKEATAGLARVRAKLADEPRRRRKKRND